MDLNEVVGSKDSKLVMGGNGFYAQCLEVALEKIYLGQLILYVARKTGNLDGSMIELTLDLDMHELVYPSATVVNLQKSSLVVFLSINRKSTKALMVINILS